MFQISFEQVYLYFSFIFNFIFLSKRCRFVQEKKQAFNLPVHWFWPVSTGSIAYPIQQSDQTGDPSGSRFAVRSGPVFKNDFD